MTERTFNMQRHVTQVSHSKVVKLPGHLAKQRKAAGVAGSGGFITTHST